ncbi:hypothetical protein Btru_005208 [Bulinus truncatus]|nr:hypothetical protein Btru_005208 [Bulinus truncatus]
MVRMPDNSKSNVEFTAHVNNKNFHLILESGTDVFASSFSAYLIHDENTTKYDIDQSCVFSGYKFGNQSIHVTAHKEGVFWSIQIYEENETYIIEPAQNVLNTTENPRNHSQVAFKSTDLNTEDFGMCGVVNSESEINNIHSIVQDKSKYDKIKFQNNSRRVKRSSADTCVLYMVGDFDLFSKRCNYNYLTCTALLVSLVHNTDRIYRASSFQDSKFRTINNIGIQIGMLILYTTPTSTSDSSYEHFNTKGVHWTAYSKLDSFEYYLSFRRARFCLSHLVTSYPMPMRILGLANRKGVCLTSRRGSLLKSASLSSTLDSQLGPITTYQMSLVFAHGHNFGSSHDPDTPECSHPESEGGNYIMWDRAGVGTQPNNKLFSPCSLRSIGETIEYSDCFLPRSLHSSFCGNGIVDEGEECDAGAVGIVSADLCCTKFCKLQPKAECRHAVIKKSKIFISSDEDACKWCCYDNNIPGNPGPCVPYSELILKDGQPCISGYCESGVCQVVFKSSIRNLKSLWESNTKKNIVVKILKNNLVLIIIFLSLLISVPIWLFIRHMDNMERKRCIIDLEKILSGALTVKSSRSSKSFEPSRSMRSIQEADWSKLSSTNVDDLSSFYLRLLRKHRDLSQTILIYSSPRMRQVKDRHFCFTFPFNS